MVLDNSFFVSPRQAAKNNFYVIIIETKTRKWATEKDTKVGDNISKAKKLYISQILKIMEGSGKENGKQIDQVS